MVASEGNSGNQESVGFMFQKTGMSVQDFVAFHAIVLISLWTNVGNQYTHTAVSRVKPL